MIQRWLERKRERDMRDFYESMSPQARATFEAPIDPKIEERFRKRLDAAVEHYYAEEEEKRRRRENRWYRRLLRAIRNRLAAW